MVHTTTSRQYGKPSKRSRAERLFAELPQSPLRKPPPTQAVDTVTCIAEQLSALCLETSAVSAGHPTPRSPQRLPPTPRLCPSSSGIRAGAVKSIEKNVVEDTENPKQSSPRRVKVGLIAIASTETPTRTPQLGCVTRRPTPARSRSDDAPLRILTWADLCPPGETIVKIAEASYAEVYRVSNERGTSIVKVIRLESPLKPQTKTQQRAGLVDEEPHRQEDVDGELQISEWLADIPGFVVYKERYIVKGKATKQLLETHQAFQRRLKRQDQDRAQFYPSPSRYVDDTSFLVVELGDAGTALEDWELADESQLWDIFLLEAVALARAEEMVLFEHRDLHEGNLCIRRTRPPRPRTSVRDGFFGHSGLEITILDYGLSRAEDLSAPVSRPVAFDLERDLSLFTSTHASQCTVYRQMRSFLLRGDRKCIPPDGHRTPYAKNTEGQPLFWETSAPYTNVLWLAYLYRYIEVNFRGPRRELTRFRKETREMWRHLDPEAADDVVCFGSAADVVGYAVDAGWIGEEQLRGVEASMLEREDSIIVSRAGSESPPRRRSLRTKQQQQQQIR